MTEGTDGRQTLLPSPEAIKARAIEIASEAPPRERLAGGMSRRALADLLVDAHASFDDVTPRAEAISIVLSTFKTEFDPVLRAYCRVEDGQKRSMAALAFQAAVDSLGVNTTVVAVRVRSFRGGTSLADVTDELIRSYREQEPGDEEFSTEFMEPIEAEGNALRRCRFRLLRPTIGQSGLPTVVAEISGPAESIELIRQRCTDNSFIFRRIAWAGQAVRVGLSVREIRFKVEDRTR